MEYEFVSGFDVPGLRAVEELMPDGGAILPARSHVPVMPFGDPVYIAQRELPDHLCDGRGDPQEYHR